MSKTLTLADRQRIDSEIARLRLSLKVDEELDVPAGESRVDHTNLLVGSTITLAVLAVAAIVTIFMTRPDKDNTAIVATLMGFLVPLMTALLAAAVQQVHAAVNSRLSQLLRVTAARSRAEGMLAAQEIHEEEGRAQKVRELAVLKAQQAALQEPQS